MFQTIQQHGFDPRDFERTEEIRSEQSGRTNHTFLVSAIIHPSSNYHFIFGAMHVTFSPGLFSRTQNEPSVRGWGMKQSLFEVWLRRLRQEVDAPDLWDSLKRERLLSDAASAPDLANTSFAEHELAMINRSLDEVKAYLLEGQQFSSEQQAFIEHEFSYLREASERVGRKDWLNLLAGALMSIVVSLALEPERARGLFAIAGTVLQSLWGVAQAYLH